MASPKAIGLKHDLRLVPRRYVKSIAKARAKARLRPSTLYWPYAPCVYIFKLILPLQAIEFTFLRSTCIICFPFLSMSITLLQFET